MYYQRKDQSSKLTLSNKIRILNFIKEALSHKGIDLSQGGVINFFDRDGTINIKNEKLRDAIQNAKGGNVVAGTLTGKLPEELNDVLKGFSFLGAAGGGMLYLPSLEKKIPFVIPPEKIKQVEEIYQEILNEYGIKDDLIQSMRLQYNSFEEEMNQGMILLLSQDPIEEKDYLARGTKKERLLEGDQEDRFEKKIVEFTALEGGKYGKQILETLYERMKQVEGIKMVPPGAFGDRTGKHTGADITALDKGDVFNIILEAYEKVIPHFMGNSTNDIPAIRATWSKDEGIVSMVLPPNLEHADTALIAMLANLAKQNNKNFVLVEPGEGEEYGSEYATRILNDPSYLGQKLISKENLEKIEKYSNYYEQMEKEGKIPQSLLSTKEELQEMMDAKKEPMYEIGDIGSFLGGVSYMQLNQTTKEQVAQKLQKIAQRNQELKQAKTKEESEGLEHD